MIWPDEYTFSAEDFFTHEQQEIGRLLIEQHGERWVLLAARAESTGGRWAVTWCGLEHQHSQRLPAGIELSGALVERLDGAPRVRPGECEAA